MGYKASGFLGALGCALAGLLWPAASRADSTVHQGWDLFQTQAGAQIDGIPLFGVPLGTYDFGSGAVNVGGTDTIIERISDATATGTIPPSKGATIGIQLSALQLETAIPLIFPGDSITVPTPYFLTLQSMRGGPASMGTASVTFDQLDQGTFSATMDVFFDIRRSSLSGPIVASQELVFSSSPIAWTKTDGTGQSLLLPGINYLLNGFDTGEDFWPSGGFEVDAPGRSTSALISTPVPEPEVTACVAGVLLGGMAVVRCMRRTP